MEQGYKQREAKRLVQALLDAIITALKVHDSVELPFGILQVVANPPPKRQFRFGTIVERYRKRHRVVLVPYEEVLDE
jgi:nucleoid DNA-binding protein